jgi:DNA-binding LacI/PurR family transcriptional regulator
VSSGEGGQKPVFGLLIPDLGETEIFEPICKGMARSVGGEGHFLSWGHSPGHSQDKEEVADHLCQQFIDQRITGVFFAPLEFSRNRDQVNHRVLRMLRGAHIPVVLLDRCVVQYPERSDYDVVGLDNRRAGYVVADHLIRKGAKCIAFLAEPGSAETVDDRIAGYREAHFVHGLKAEKEMVLGSDGADVGFLEQALRSHRIDAIQCANDHTAARLMRSLLSLGVRIPEDIRIAGVDDVKYAGLLPVPLTTYHQPCVNIGAVAIAAMRERVGNPRLAARSIALNGHLVVRQSCGSGLSAAASAG